MPLTTAKATTLHWNYAAICAAILADDVAAVKREVLRLDPRAVEDNVRKRLSEEARRLRQRRILMGIMTNDDVVAAAKENGEADEDIDSEELNRREREQLLNQATEDDMFRPATDLHDAVVKCYLSDIADFIEKEEETRVGADEDNDGDSEGAAAEREGRALLSQPDSVLSPIEIAKKRRAEKLAEEDAKHPHTAALRHQKKAEAAAERRRERSNRRVLPKFLPQGIVHVAAANNKFNTLEWVLAVAPECVFWAADTSKWTPLHYAAFNGHEKAVGVLLKNGSDRDAEDTYGETAGEVAAQSSVSAATLALLGEFGGGGIHFDIEGLDEADLTSSDDDEHNALRPIVGVNDESTATGVGGSNNNAVKKSSRASDADEGDPAERAKRIRQRKRRKIAKLKQQTTMEEKMKAQAKALEEELRVQKMMEELEAKELEEQRQQRKGRIAKRKEARQYYENIRIGLMLDHLQARQRLAFEILCEREQLFRANGLQFYYDHVVDVALAVNNAWYLEKKRSEAQLAREAAIAAEKARRKKKKKRKSALTNNTSSSSPSRSPVPQRGRKASLPTAAEVDTTAITVEPEPIPPPIPIHYQNLFLGISFEPEKDFPIPEALLPGSKVFLNKADKFKLAKQKNIALKRRRENKELLANAHTQLDLLFAEERSVFESIESVARRQIEALHLCEAATYIYFPFEPSIDRKHFDLSTGKIGRYQYNVETEVFRWSCCGQKGDPCAPGCVAAPDDLRPTYHPGSYRYHFDDGSCCWHLMKHAEKRKAKKRLANQQRLSNAVRSAMTNGTEVKRKEVDKKRRVQENSDGTVDATDDMSSGDESDGGSSVNTNDMARDEALDSAVRSSLANSNAVKGSGGGIGSASDNAAALSSDRMLKHPHCNPSGYSWTCCGSTDADADGCESRKRILYFRHQLLSAPFSVLHLPTCLEDREQMYMRLRYPVKQGGSAGDSDLLLAAGDDEGDMGGFAEEGSDRFNFRQDDGSFLVLSSSSREGGGGGGGSSVGRRKSISFGALKANDKSRIQSEITKASRKVLHSAFRTTGAFASPTADAGSDPLEISDDFSGGPKALTALRTTTTAASNANMDWRRAFASFSAEEPVPGDATHSAAKASANAALSPNAGAKKPKTGPIGRGFLFRNRSTSIAEQRPTDAELNDQAARETHRRQKVFSKLRRQIYEEVGVGPANLTTAAASNTPSWDLASIAATSKAESLEDDLFSTTAASTEGFVQRDTPRVRPVTAEDMLKRHEEKMRIAKNADLAARGQTIADPSRPSLPAVISTNASPTAARTTAGSPNGLPPRACAKTSRKDGQNNHSNASALQQQQKRVATSVATFLLKAYHKSRPVDRSLVVVLQPGEFAGDALKQYVEENGADGDAASDAAHPKSNVVTMSSDDDDEADGFEVDETVAKVATGTKQTSAVSASNLSAQQSSVAETHRNLFGPSKAAAAGPQSPFASTATTSDVTLASILEFTMCGRTVRHLGRRLFFPMTHAPSANAGVDSESSSFRAGSHSQPSSPSSAAAAPILAPPPPGTLGTKTLKTNSTRVTIFGSLAVQPYSLYEHVYLENKRRAAEQKGRRARMWGKLKLQAAGAGSDAAAVGGGGGNVKSFSKVISAAMTQLKAAAKSDSEGMVTTPAKSPTSRARQLSTMMPKSTAIVIDEDEGFSEHSPRLSNTKKEGANDGGEKTSDNASADKTLDDPSSTTAPAETAQISPTRQQVAAAKAPSSNAADTDSAMAREFARRHPLPPQTSREYQKQMRLAGQIGGGFDTVKAIAAVAASNAATAGANGGGKVRSSIIGAGIEAEGDAKKAVALTDEAVLRSKAQRNSGGHQPFGASTLLYRPLRSNVVAFEYVIVRCPISVVSHQLGGIVRGSEIKAVESREQMVLGICLRDFWRLGKEDWARDAKKKRRLAEKRRKKKREQKQKSVGDNQQKDSALEVSSGEDSSNSEDSVFDSDEDTTPGGYGNSPFFVQKATPTPSQNPHQLPPHLRKKQAQRRLSAAVPLQAGDSNNDDALDVPSSRNRRESEAAAEGGPSKALSSRVLFELAMKKLWNDSIDEDKMAEMARRRTTVALGGRLRLEGGGVSNGDGDALIPVVASVAVPLQAPLGITGAAATTSQEEGEEEKRMPKPLPIPPIFNLKDPLNAPRRLRASSAGGNVKPVKSSRLFADNSLDVGLIQSVVIVDPHDTMVPPNVFYRKNYFDPKNPSVFDSDEEAEDEAMRMLARQAEEEEGNGNVGIADDTTTGAMSGSQHEDDAMARIARRRDSAVFDSRAAPVHDGVVRRRRSTVVLQQTAVEGTGSRNALLPQQGAAGRRGTTMRRRSKSVIVSSTGGGSLWGTRQVQQRPAPQSNALALPATVPELMTQHNIFIGSGGGGRPDDVSGIRPSVLKTILSHIVGAEATMSVGEKREKPALVAEDAADPADEEGSNDANAATQPPARAALQKRPTSAVSTIASATDDTASTASYRHDWFMNGERGEIDPDEEDAMEYKPTQNMPAPNRGGGKSSPIAPPDYEAVQERAEQYEKELVNMQVAMAAQSSIGWWAHSTHIRGLGGMISEEAKDTYGKENDCVAIVIDGPNNCVFFFKNRVLVATVSLPTRRSAASASANRKQKDPLIEERKRRERELRFQKEAKEERRQRRRERRAARERRRQESKARAIANGTYQYGQTTAAVDANTRDAFSSAASSSSTESSDGEEVNLSPQPRINDTDVSVVGADSSDDGDLSWTSSDDDSFGSRSGDSTTDEDADNSHVSTAKSIAAASIPNSGSVSSAALSIFKINEALKFKGGKHVHYTPKSLIAALDRRLDPTPFETFSRIYPPDEDTYRRNALTAFGLPIPESLMALPNSNVSGPTTAAGAALLPPLRAAATSPLTSASNSRAQTPATSAKNTTSDGRGGSPPRGATNTSSSRVGGGDASSVAQKNAAEAVASADATAAAKRAIDFSYKRSSYISPMLGQLAREMILTATDIYKHHCRWKAGTSSTAAKGTSEEKKMMVTDAKADGSSSSQRFAEEDERLKKALLTPNTARPHHDGAKGSAFASTSGSSISALVTQPKVAQQPIVAATVPLPPEVVSPARSALQLAMCYMFDTKGADEAEQSLFERAAQCNEGYIAATIDSRMTQKHMERARLEYNALVEAQAAAEEAARQLAASGGKRKRRVNSPNKSLTSIASTPQSSIANASKSRANSADWGLPPPSSSSLGVDNASRLRSSLASPLEQKGEGSNSNQSRFVEVRSGGGLVVARKGTTKILPPLGETPTKAPGTKKALPADGGNKSNTDAASPVEAEAAVPQLLPLDSSSMPASRRKSRKLQKLERSKTAEARFIDTMRMYEQNPRFRAMCGTAAGRLMSLLMALHGHDTSTTAVGRGVDGAHDGTNDVDQHRIPLKKWQRVQGYNNQVWVPAVTLVEGCAVSAEPTYGRPWLAYVDGHFKNRVAAERIFRLGYVGRGKGGMSIGLSPIYDPANPTAGQIAQQQQQRVSTASLGSSMSSASRANGQSQQQQQQQQARFLTETTVKANANVPMQIQAVRTGQFLARLNSLANIQREMEERRIKKQLEKQGVSIRPTFDDEQPNEDDHHQQQRTSNASAAMRSPSIAKRNNQSIVSSPSRFGASSSAHSRVSPTLRLNSSVAGKSNVIDSDGSDDGGMMF